MALIPYNEGGSFDITAEEKKESGLKWQDVMYGVVVITLLFLLISPLPPEYKTIGLGAIHIETKYLLVFFLILLYIQRTVIRFNEYERGVVLRMGKFDRIAGPGWALVFPLLEKYFKVDLRLQVLTVPPQEVVTRDKVRFIVSPEIFLYVTDPKDAVINVEDYKKAVLNYLNSSLTHECGNLTSDHIITHMDGLTRSLEERLEHISRRPGKEWGIDVVKIKLTLVRFPDRVQDAMHEKVASEQLKLAAHEKAEATKIEIDAIREAGGKLTDPAITYMYLESLDKIARGRATKIVLPLEITKIAETISKSTGKTVTTTGLPDKVVDKYVEVMENYDKRIQNIEGKLEYKPGEGRDEVEAAGERDKGEGDAGKKREDEYDKKIREIKERLGIDD